MIGIDIHFARMLIERLDEEIERRAREVAGGLASSFDDYRQRTGFIAGLMGARKIAEEVEKTLNGSTSKDRQA